MTHYKNHTVEVQDNADGAAVIISSIPEASQVNDITVQSDSVAGTYYPEQISTVAQKQMFRYSSFDIPKVIDAFGLIGRDVISGSGKIGVAQYQAKYNNATISAGSTHRRLIFSKSYNMIRTISVSHRQDARAQCESMAIYDGTNNPMTFGENVALPTLPASSGRWTLAAISIGGVAIPCNVQLDIDFGITVESFGCDSDVWDTHLNLDDIKPKISITSLDPSIFKTSAGVPLIGLAGTHANTEIYLRKRVTSGLASFVADVTAEHVKITADGVLHVVEGMNASGNQKGQTRLEMTCRFDGTNAPLVFDTSSAIT
jgi:hypothetical protein